MSLHDPGRPSGATLAIEAPPPSPRPAAAGTLGTQLAAHFAERIRHRALMPGARLPSVRECARQHRVSPSTVVLAYDQLQAQGLVEARRQRGFFVRGPIGSPGAAAGGVTRGLAPAGALIPPDAAPALLSGGAALVPPVDATALIRGMFQRASGQPITGAQATATATASRLIGPGPGQGTLPEAWLDPELLTRALRRALPDAQEALRYGEPAGDSGLRQALARRLTGDLGLAATPAQIVTTTGATHALDLVARTLLRPGDAVLVDEPGWAVEFARLTRLGMRLLPVPRCKDGADGPDLAEMERLLIAHRPRLYVTVSVLHNPTGHTLSLAHAHRILKLADAHDLTIVEDDTYAWLAPNHAPRLSALDGLQRTVYVSGFSKILAPNWRVGYVAAAPALTERLIDTKLLTTLTTPSLMERAVAWCLDQGLLRRHAERVRQQLDAARQRVVRLAEASGCRFVTPPQGLFGWVDTGVDTDALATRMADAGWLLAPGSLFHAMPRPTPLMRLNFASAQDRAFWQAFDKARL
ncbi:PLP-dependent aminotransferase family protein [Ideonella sp. DXS22W]|uniref:PLP-dependent aminotransferase family protein n=1 Tax=Pseudaquabacterium inlustre TaxID=2984192 RepID=A0ABU9CR41_9BURK